MGIDDRLLCKVRLSRQSEDLILDSLMTESVGVLLLFMAINAVQFPASPLNRPIPKRPPYETCEGEGQCDQMACFGGYEMMHKKSSTRQCYLVTLEARNVASHLGRRGDM